jgi:hypothetical protein
MFERQGKNRWGLSVGIPQAPNLTTHFARSKCQEQTRLHDVEICMIPQLRACARESDLACESGHYSRELGNLGRLVDGR